MNPQLITNLVIPPVEPKEILSAVGSRRITERDLKDAEKASKAAGLLMKAAGAFLLLDMKTLGSWKFFKKIICPCVYHKDEIREQGHCHCLLFVADEKKS